MRATSCEKRGDFANLIGPKFGALKTEERLRNKRK